VTKNGEPKVANALLTQAKDIFLKMRSKLSALLSTLRQLVQNVRGKKPESNL
jgi:hypothetical protein